MLKCSKHPEQKEFYGVAHVTEDWIVDEHGDFLEIHPHSEAIVVAEPQDFICPICGDFVDEVVDKPNIIDWR